MNSQEYKYCYVTLVSSEEYLKPALILNLSFINANSKFPLLLMITEDIFNENIKNILKKENILYKVIPVLTYAEKTLLTIEKEHPENKTLKNTASKLNIFNLDEYDKIIYVDADSVIFQNVDSLFNFPDGSMSWDGKEGLTSLLVLCPKNHNYDYYISVMKDNNCVDGNLIGDLWFQHKSNVDYRIPINYCSFTYDENNFYYSKMITFTDHKLWRDDLNLLLNSNNPIYNLYGKYLKEINNKYY